MALWQYTFQILPKESYSILKDNIALSFDDALFDDEPYWKYILINKNHFDAIDKTLPRRKAWSKEIDLYGNLESTCLEVFYNTQTKNVCSAFFRIDFTIDFEMILKELIEFLIFQGFVILDENFQLATLNYEKVKSIIDNSKQAKRYNELQRKSSI